MPDRAALSAFETSRETIHRHGHAISVSYGYLTLHMPDGTSHQFPFVSGGYGRGAAPGLHEPLASAQHATFDGITDVRAVYGILSGVIQTDEPGIKVGNVGYKIVLGSPLDAHRGRTLAEYRQGKHGSLLIHSDGDTQKDFTDPSVHGDGLADDGTNGCFGLSSKDAARFEQLYTSLPPAQRPQALYVLDPAQQSLPVGNPKSFFPNVGR